MRVLIAALAVVLSGCATNPYKKFYVDQTGGKDFSEFRSSNSSDEPRMVQADDPVKTGKEMYKDGYLMLGYSQFSGRATDYSDAVSFAKAIHADVVTVYSSYVDTLSGTMSIPMTTNSTSYSMGNGTAYGNGGRASVYGSGVTATTGTQMTSIPYSVDRFNHGAQYWIKRKPAIFGAMVKDLSDEKRHATASNKGAEVTLVVKDSPAFNADVMDGDIIKKIDGHEVGSAKDYIDTLQTVAGKKVDVDLIRDGKPITKTVRLNESK